MTTTTRHRTALLALATAGALALGACGGGGSTTTSAPAGASASASPSATSSASASSSAPATTDAGSSGSGSGSSAVPAAGSTVPGTTFGTEMVSALKKAGSGKATMTITQGSTKTAMDMEFVFGSDGAMQAHATMTGGMVGGAATEVVVADGATYVKLPKAVNGKAWFKTSAGNAASAADPASIATSFSAAKVVYVGEQGGLRHYTITMTGTGAGTVQAYLDDQGRPAKFTGQVAGSTLDATYSDWGTPVTVTPPPASQVTTTMG